MARNAHGGFPEKIRFPRFWAKRYQNGPKIDLFGFFSKSAPRIFLILCIWLEGIIALILPKTACSAKIRFRSYGPKRPKNRVFSKAHISSKVRAIENLIRFLESSVLSLQKTPLSDFPYLDPFTLKIESEHRNRKKSQFWFFDFLEFGSSDFLHIAQGLLQWRFHVDCIFGSEVMTLGPKIQVPKLVFRFSQVRFVRFHS